MSVARLSMESGDKENEGIVGRFQGAGIMLQRSLLARPKANQKAKGKGQKCSSPHFRTSIFQIPISIYFPHGSEAKCRGSYLLEMKVRAIMSFRINEWFDRLACLEHRQAAPGPPPWPRDKEQGTEEMKCEC
jgi:hypothetical protein